MSEVKLEVTNINPEDQRFLEVVAEDYAIGINVVDGNGRHIRRLLDVSSEGIYRYDLAAELNVGIETQPINSTGTCRRVKLIK